MTDRLQMLYNVILQRKTNPQEGSYTNYLLDSGLDKILKKVAEEAGETIIAAKNAENTALVGEICDLLYHVMVLAAQRGLCLDDIFVELDTRSQKIGNLKPSKTVDKIT